MAQRKGPVRRTKKTILIIGEGSTEKAFLQYIKGLYITRDMDISIKIECGSGGSPRNVVEKAIRLCGSRGYDKCFVLIDADIPLRADRKLFSRMKKRPKIIVLKSTPCIEGLFLVILGYAGNNSSNQCKNIFESKYLAPNKKTDKRSYEHLFSKDMLDEKRILIIELNNILKAMSI